MEKEFTVKEFCTGFDQCETDEDKAKYVKKNLKTTKYVFIKDKVTQIDRVCNIMFNRETHEVDYIFKHIMTLLSYIDLYTNISVNYANAIDEYDYLEHNQAGDYIASNLPEDISEFQMLLDLHESEIMTNDFSIFKAVNNVIDRLAIIVSKGIEEAINNIQIPEETDKEE